MPPGVRGAIGDVWLPGQSSWRDPDQASSVAEIPSDTWIAGLHVLVSSARLLHAM